MSWRQHVLHNLERRRERLRETEGGGRDGEGGKEKEGETGGRRRREGETEKEKEGGREKDVEGGGRKWREGGNIGGALLETVKSILGK